MEKVEQKAAELKEAINANVEAKISEKAQEMNARLAEIEVKLQKSTEQKMEEKSFTSTFGELIAKNFDAIKEVSLGNKVKMNLKAVGTMTVANNLTGDAIRTYQPVAKIM